MLGMIATYGLRRMYQYGIGGVAIGVVIATVFCLEVVMERALRNNARKGFDLLGHISRRRPVDGPDIQLAFDPDLAGQREVLLTAYHREDDGGP